MTEEEEEEEEEEETILRKWFRASHSMCIQKVPTRCNTSILVLLQDHSTCFGYFSHPSSGVK
jgi:hypothetical protein